jgi:hypothetical protein
MDISALFGTSSDWASILAARQQARDFASVGTGQTADSVKSTISNATRLNDSSKETLTKLTDTVSEFADGDPKLLRDIEGLANLMQFGQTEQDSASSPYARLLSAAYSQKTGGFVDLLS